MQLRECLISLVGALRRRAKTDALIERPQDANFIEWSALLIDHVCPGHRNKELRQYLKGTAKDIWQLVNWLTHDRSANKTAAAIALHGCSTIVGHYVAVFERENVDRTEQCPLCKSRHIRHHFDPAIAPDGDYFESCGKCGWNSHPISPEMEDHARRGSVLNLADFRRNCFANGQNGGMGNPKRKRTPKTILRLPGLEHSKTADLNT